MRLIENHMAIGLPYPAGWEQPEPDAAEEFEKWYENAPLDLHYQELFFDAHDYLELGTWMELGTMKREFNLYKAERMKEEFEEATGLDIDLDHVKQTINE